MKINFVIPCLLGLEKLIADELKELGAENVVSENGRVLFSGDEHILPVQISVAVMPKEFRFLSALSRQEALKSFSRAQRLFLGSSG